LKNSRFWEIAAGDRAGSALRGRACSETRRILHLELVVTTHIVCAPLKIWLLLLPAVPRDTMFIRLKLDAANDMNADAIDNDPKAGLSPIRIDRFPATHRKSGKIRPVARLLRLG
jgi:hypothetical protein